VKGYVYIMSNKNNSVFYAGVTTDLRARVDQHKNRKHPDSFTSRYNICKLLWFETLDSISLAIKREKQIKAGPRSGPHNDSPFNLLHFLVSTYL
jgi:putative endonuclease